MSRFTALAVAAAAAIVLSACSLPGSDASSGYSSASDAKAVGAPSAKVLTPPRGTILSANSTAQLGTVVIDGLGRTLYRFDQDKAKPPTATCEGACASTWPPVLSEPGAPVTLEGVAENEVGTVTRPDGSKQVTIGGWPVYTYSADPAPGATTGHGMKGTWFAVTPTGAKAAAQ